MQQKMRLWARKQPSSIFHHSQISIFGGGTTLQPLGVCQGPLFRRQQTLWSCRKSNPGHELQIQSPNFVRNRTYRWYDNRKWKTLYNSIAYDCFCLKWIPLTTRYFDLWHTGMVNVWPHLKIFLFFNTDVFRKFTHRVRFHRYLQALEKYILL